VALNTITPNPHTQINLFQKSMQWYMVYILTPPKPSRDKSPDCTTLLASTSKAVADEMGKGV
jgi:hypothetical protein